MANISMLAGIWNKIGDIVSGFFAIIPQFMYFLYASIASLLDAFQYVFRKLAGLDVYYVNGVKRSGDLVTDFIEGILGINGRYSALNTVFWSMIIFGVIVLFLMTIITIIKAHYNYDSKKSDPFYILKYALKSLATMAIIPLTTLLGLYLGSGLFKALDTITTPNLTAEAKDLFDSSVLNKFASSSTSKTGKDAIYTSFDFFGEHDFTSTSSFSGIMFKACSTSANRVRNGSYSAFASGHWDNAGVFLTNIQNETTDDGNGEIENPNPTSQQVENVASQIDFAFANNMSLIEKHNFQISGLDEAEAAIASSLTYGPSAIFAAGLTKVQYFSKYNVGLVWYFYNLWTFNFILGFIGIVIMITLFTNILFGMAVRIIICAAMFLVYPPITGIMPFDEGTAIKNWRTQFVSYIISAYASIAGMNIIFLLFPLINSISFFNQILLDRIISIIFMVVALTIVKTFIAFVSGFVGAKDLNEVGSNIKKDGAKGVMRGVGATVAFGALSMKATGLARGLDRRVRTSRPVMAIKNKIRTSKVGTAFTTMGTAIKNAGTSVVGKVGPVLRKAGQSVSAFGRRFARNPFGKIVLSRFGVPVDEHLNSEYETYNVYDENGAVIGTEEGLRDGVDAAGNVKHIKRKRPMAIIKEGLVDISRLSIKAIGEVTGVKGMITNLDKNTQAVETMRAGVNDIYEGIARLAGFGQVNPPFKTKDMKKQEESEVEYGKALLENGADTSTTNLMVSEIDKLINEIK